MKTRTLIAVIVLAVSGAQAQGAVRKVIQSEQKFAVARGGAFVLENAIGNVDVVGADVPNVQATVATVIVAENAAAVDDARRQVGLIVGGDDNVRVVRTTMPPPGREKRNWSAEVTWNVRVPRMTSVRVLSSSNSRIRISNLNGNVHIKNFNGNVAVTNVGGLAVVESVNGSISYVSSVPRHNVVLSTVNGHVNATVDGSADFRWVAETATGQIQTNLPARGAFFGATFRGSVNAPGGPTITTRSMMGNIRLSGSGAVSTRPAQDIRRVAGAPMPASQMRASGPRVLRRGTVQGFFSYETNLGDVKVTEIRGDAKIATGAGEVQIGAVSGNARVSSLGGPLQLGEILGTLTASTRAGDILVDSTRRGGTIETQGGTIRLLYTSGPTRLKSGGGDIIVRQAAAPVAAVTTSGDVSITLDPGSTTETIDARTGKGNVVLNVDSRFRADVDATILTGDPAADTFLSDIPGLSVSRDQVGGKTRVRAVGRINGGGEKVTLSAIDGDIRITTGGAGPTVVRR